MYSETGPWWYRRDCDSGCVETKGERAQNRVDALQDSSPRITDVGASQYPLAPGKRRRDDALSEVANLLRLLPQLRGRRHGVPRGPLFVR